MTVLPKVAAEKALPEDYRNFIEQIKESGFAGEIDVSYSGRLIAATDNSVYQNLPQAVLYPLHHADLVLLMQLAGQESNRSVQFSPRGGGTGTNGQSLTSGIVIDISRHMNKVLEVNPKEGWVRVQAGVVKDQLNDILRPHGYFFSPDLSTSNRATLGGMINTDASGQGSLVYGKTSDHILGLKTVLLDGSVMDSLPVSLEQAETIAGQDTHIARVYRQVIDTCVGEVEKIRDKFPPLNRFLTGYDLKHAYSAKQQSIDVSRIIAGSEGTLGFVSEARLNITPIPKHRVLVNVKYSNFQAALENSPFLVDARATSVETVDSTVLNLAREDIIWKSVQPLLSDVEGQRMDGINMVEFTGLDQNEIDGKVNALTERLDKLIKSKDNKGVIGYQVCDDLPSIQLIYAMRKKSVGLLGATKGRRKPVAFAEDTAVPPEKLAEFISEFRALLDANGLNYGMFGHADAGVLHVRPALDMCEPDDEVLLRQISDKVAELTQKYGGLMWGEHGKGYRSEYVPSFFGQQLYTELQKIKATFDPCNQLNPGKICTPLNTDAQLVSVDSVKRGFFDRQIPVETRDSYKNAMDCNGNGLCFNYDPKSAMCPSYKVTKDRRYSPKGRAGLLREWLRLTYNAGYDAAKKPESAGFLKRQFNRFTAKDDFSHEVKQSMDKCLACKACTNQCPVNVDVPTFRARFYDHYYSKYARPVKDYLVKGIEKTAPVASKVPMLSNLLINNFASRLLLKYIVGYVDTPLFSAPNLKTAWRRNGLSELTTEQILNLTGEEQAQAVVIAQDPFTTYYEADFVLKLGLLIEKLGYTPILLPFIGHGKAQHVKGFLSDFDKTAVKVTEQLQPLSDAGIPLIGPDSSTALIFRDEYRKSNQGQLPEVNVMTVIEWLNTLDFGETIPVSTSHYGLLLHCTEQSFVPESAQQWQTLFQKLGLKLDIVNVGCCGMAGTFGHEKQNQDDSLGLYEMGWQQAVQRYGSSGVLATGFSCRSQIKRIEKKRVRHPLEIILQSLT
ncbi:D-2-hydroxyglutarate dehydrogenase YdiJ [Idiomarina aminovorans]|uniref:D-2-hydroxyglutarate dehydrogenase YdiJ n=1 Tax=Idiomarina aminovorans TaxID=2914829 RepID=UPI00200571E0|nr:FAD-binding and (Fe-S)-binding domain-containing protein [Idiomarina sp. ATCH4]MCK7458568.1 FAD-binding oxidoreductase [Idiomarina sp. ATCH4]